MCIVCICLVFQPFVERILFFPLLCISHCEMCVCVVVGYHTAQLLCMQAFVEQQASITAQLMQINQQQDSEIQGLKETVALLTSNCLLNLMGEVADFTLFVFLFLFFSQSKLICTYPLIVRPVSLSPVFLLSQYSGEWKASLKQITRKSLKEFVSSTCRFR